VLGAVTGVASVALMVPGSVLFTGDVEIVTQLAHAAAPIFLSCLLLSANITMVRRCTHPAPHSDD
jgi:hypothetical protein